MSSTIQPEVKSYQQVQFERRAPIECGYKRTYTFNQSLARLKRAGYVRHPSPQEVFSFLADGLENKLNDEQKRIYHDMSNGSGEWLDMAGERKRDTLILYSGNTN